MFKKKFETNRRRKWQSSSHSIVWSWFLVVSNFYIVCQFQRQFDETFVAAFFLQSLLNVYELYLKKRSIDLERKKIKWYRRITYYTNEKNRRHVYNTEDFIIVDDEKTRLIQCLLHEYKRKRYEFLVIDFVNNTMLINFVFDLIIYTKSKNHRIYSIIAISNEIIYFIDASNESNWQTKKETKYFMHCT